MSTSLITGHHPSVDPDKIVLEYKTGWGECYTFVLSNTDVSLVEEWRNDSFEPASVFAMAELRHIIPYHHSSIRDKKQRQLDFHANVVKRWLWCRDPNKAKNRRCCPFLPTVPWLRTEVPIPIVEIPDLTLESLATMEPHSRAFLEYRFAKRHLGDYSYQIYECEIMTHSSKETNKNVHIER